jgi:hypothetical protein
VRYIRQVHVDYPGTSNEHISQVKSSNTATGALLAETREQVVRAIDDGRESYRSHEDRTGDEARVDTRTSSRGTRYIATVADGRETNNLLSLPRF